MKVGIALNMLTKEGRTDASVVGEHLALGDLAEPLGFDSLWALEHHFTGYAMSPAPTQLLAYYAGRTKRLVRSEEHTSELQSLAYLVCRLLLEKKKTPFSRSPYTPTTP